MAWLTDKDIKTPEEMTDEELKTWRDEIENDDSFWSMDDELTTIEHETQEAEKNLFTIPTDNPYI